MGSPFGREGYYVNKDRMRHAENNLFDNTGQGYSPGSSGYNTGSYDGGNYGVNPETGRSFTTQPKYSDYVKEGDPSKAFAGIANAQKTAMQRGMAGGNRSAVSSFGNRGLGLGGAGGAMADNRRNLSRGMADVERKTGMDKLGYNTDLYKYDRGQSLQEESALRNARQGDNTGMRNDYAANLAAILQQFNMDRGAANDMYNQYSNTYNQFQGNADQGSSGWAAPVANWVGETFLEGPEKISIF